MPKHILKTGLQLINTKRPYMELLDMKLEDIRMDNRMMSDLIGKSRLLYVYRLLDGKRDLPIYYLPDNMFELVMKVALTAVKKMSGWGGYFTHWIFTDRYAMLKSEHMVLLFKDGVLVAIEAPHYTYNRGLIEEAGNIERCGHLLDNMNLRYRIEPDKIKTGFHNKTSRPVTLLYDSLQYQVLDYWRKRHDKIIIGTRQWNPVEGIPSFIRTGRCSSVKNTDTNRYVNTFEPCNDILSEYDYTLIPNIRSPYGQPLLSQD